MATSIEKVQAAPRSRLSSDEVQRVLAGSSFAVIGYATPAGDPRSSGVVYKMKGGRMYISVEPDGWKARHIAAAGRVAVTVPVHRGGLMALMLPIPPATISFHGSARVFEPGSLEARIAVRELKGLLPKERQASASIVEVTPEGYYSTYGVGVPLMKMREPAAARARVRVT
jgi:hypothetical protein